MRDNDLFNRMDDLHSKVTTSLSPRMIEEYEEMDVLVCKLMAEAEKQCCKLRTGTIPWSPAYRISCLQLEYWLKRRSYFKKENTNVRELLVIQKELKLPYNPNMTLPDINMEVKLAHAKRRKCKESAESMSLEYRTQLALARE